MCWDAIRGYLLDVALPWRDVKLPIVAPEQYGEVNTSLAAGVSASIKTPTVPMLLLTEVKRVVDFKVASIRALEGKAVAQMGVSGTVLGLLAAFSANIATAWKALPLSLLLLAILAYLQAIYIRTGSLPSLGAYMTDTIVTDETNEGKIALQLATAWNDYGLEAEQSNLRKARFVRSGNLWLRLALVSVVLVEFFAPRS
jgi:hypothetical protein